MSAGSALCSLRSLRAPPASALRHTTNPPPRLRWGYGLTCDSVRQGAASRPLDPHDQGLGPWTPARAAATPPPHHLGVVA